MNIKKINLFITGLIIITCLAPFSVFAQGKHIVVNDASGGSHFVHIISEKATETIILFNLNEIILNPIDTQHEKSFVVSSIDAPQILKTGVPDLFYLTRSIIIPNTGTAEIEVIPGDFAEYPNIEIAPSKGNLFRNVDPKDIPFRKGSVYQQNLFFPQELVNLRDPYILRDFRGQTIDVFPVQYNPVTKTLRVYKNIKVILSYSSKKGENEILNTDPPKYFDSEFVQVYQRMFLNFSKKKYTPVEEEGDLLIICYDDFMDAMKPFVNWKRSIGRKTEIVAKSDVGTTSNAIKSYIADYYNNPEKNLAYVLLVGDAAQIPTNVTSSGDSDNTYGYINGDDSYSEIFMGRFSAETIAHVETQVQKMVEYERDLNSSDTWMSKGLGVARNEGAGNGHNGEADYVHIDFIRDTLLNYNYTEVYREYDGGVPGLTNTTASAISAKINNGVGIVNYCNHGSETGWSVAGYESSHVNALSNNGKLPFIWAVACVNGAFVNTTCFAETWLRATHQGEPSGAVGTFMSSINQAWQPPMTGQDEMITILSESFENNIKRTFGGLSFNGSLKMLDVHGASGKETYDTWTLFGDPTLLVRTNTPMEMIVSHEATLFIGSTSFNVSCNTDGAIVTLSYIDEEENVQILSSAKVIGGIAALEFSEPISNIMTLDITATAYNKTTYLSQVSSVAADRPYIILSAFSTSESPNYNQDVSINISLKNVSESPYSASITSATISSTNDFVVITDNVFEAGTIAPGQLVDFQNAFGISIPENIPDQNKMIFSISFSYNYNDTQYESTQTFSIKANAPVLTLGNFNIEDDGEGIPGILDPGETANLEIIVNNDGHADAQSVSVTLESSSNLLIVNGSDPVSIGAIAAGASADAIISITASDEIPLETEIELTVTSLTGNLQSTSTITLVIGHIPEYIIGETDEVVACLGKFFDSGGISGTYAESENKIITFKPSSENSALLFNFTFFDVEEGYDFLYVYNGETLASPQVAGSPFSGSNKPKQLMGTSESGALTFKFVSDDFVSTDGWEAEFSCIDLSIPPICAVNPMPEDEGSAIVSPTILTWDFVSGALQYDIYFGKDILPTSPTTTVSTNSYSAQLEENSEYFWRVVPKNDAGQAEGCQTWTFTTNDLADVIKMYNGSTSTCNSVFYDSGGIENDYQDNQNQTLTISPTDPWAKLKVTFSEFNVETDYDFLKIYNGSSTAATLFGSYTGSSLPSTITSTNKNGALTFRFQSDEMVSDKGWAAHLTCEKINQPITFKVTNALENPIEGVKITTPIDEIFTNSEGIANIELPQNCEYSYTLTKDGYQIKEGIFTVGQQPGTVSLVIHTVSNPTNSLDIIQVYPNPFTSVLNIYSKEKILSLSLLSALGHEVMRLENQNSQIISLNTKQLPNGVYIVVMNTVSKGTITKKLVKE